jgi:hypothetical protein
MIDRARRAWNGLLAVVDVLLTEPTLEPVELPEAPCATGTVYSTRTRRRATCDRPAVRR